MLTTQSTAPTKLHIRNLRAVHPGGAGDDGDVGPHERHEAADHQGLAAVLLEERLGLGEVLPLEDPAVVLVERWPDLAADLVADDVAGERRRGERDEGEGQVDAAGRRARSSIFSPAMNRPIATSRVSPGQEREEQPALDEDDRQADPEERGAELVEQPVGVHPLDAEEQWHQQGRRTHGVRIPADPQGSGVVANYCRGRGRSARAVRPDAARAARGRRRSVGGRRGRSGEQYDARAARRGGPAQRRRPLPLLDDGGDRRRPRPPPARLPRGDRELAARLQHRHHRPLGQRLPRRRGAHRRQPPLEPPRRDGHRPLPAPAAPRRGGRPGGVPPRA